MGEPLWVGVRQVWVCEREDELGVAGRGCTVPHMIPGLRLDPRAEGSCRGETGGEPTWSGVEIELQEGEPTGLLDEGRARAEVWKRLASCWIQDALPPTLRRYSATFPRPSVGIQRHWRHPEPETPGFLLH